jgi:hypothetical protein
MNDTNSEPIEQPNVKTRKKKGCGSTVLIIITVACVLVSVGGYLIYDQFVKAPEGLEVSVNLPPLSYNNETLPITLSLKNIAEKPINVTQIQLGKTLLKYLHYNSSSTNLEAPEDYPDYMAYGSDLTIEPGSSTDIELEFRANKRGFFAGDIAVLSGNRRITKEINGLIVGDLLYETEFSEPDSNWTAISNENTSHSFEEGEYWIQLLTEMVTTWDTFDVGDSDVIMSVDTRVEVPSGDGFYGLVCREKSAKTQRMVLLVVSEDGYFNILKQEDEESLSLIDGWQYSEELFKSEPENIVAGCAGNRFWLGYDMNFLVQATDETGNPITSGNVGLVIGNYEGGSDFTVAFDNFKVYKH